MYLKHNKKPRVIMFSHSFPDEIVRALDADPCYVFGGSFSSSQFENVFLPKDSNDQAKSILGILKSNFFNLDKNDVVLIPYSNDNYKLIESSIKNITNVIGYDIPTGNNDLDKKRYIIEIKRVTHELSKIIKKHIYHCKLKKEFIKSKDAALAFNDLEDLYNNNQSSALSLSGYVFVMNTYYMSKNKKDWTNHVIKLTNELKIIQKTVENPKDFVALAGSPIYPPNYKILFELEELNINVKKVFHKDNEYILMFKQYSDSINFNKLAELYLSHNMEENSIEKLSNNNNFKGIIFHIVKGESQFAYNYNKIANKLNNLGLPVIKIETVYDYEDIEQIRLRLEAFSEMLREKLE
ncbi:MAG: 2-hydroxyacyl-CoA dehydratase family protein [Bacilli bacterium]|nr:2-hydroxyacyl-CoA dehydratase family protein [Bacilli bacterium]